MITAATERELDRWPLNRPFALAPRMQAITLDVIMAGIFGIEGKPERGTPEDRMRSTVKRLVNASTSPVGQAGELLNIGREEAVGVIKLGVDPARPADLRGDQGPPRRRAPGGAPRHPLAAAAGAHRGGRGDGRQRSPRRAAHPRPRRPRDDRQLARPGPGSAWSATRTPTRPCARRPATAATPRSRSRRRSSRACARARSCPSSAAA